MGWDLTDSVIGSFQRKTHRWSESLYRQAQGQPGWRLPSTGPQTPHTITGTADKTARNGVGKIDYGFNELWAQPDIPRPNYLRENSITFEIFSVFTVMFNCFSDTQKKSIQIISATLLNFKKRSINALFIFVLHVFHVPSESSWKLAPAAKLAYWCYCLLMSIVPVNLNWVQKQISRNTPETNEQPGDWIWQKDWFVHVKQFL